ncbi:MAG: hypothetical protein K5875_06915 [Saccharofermentans sp.]|nr:hypothetical protein [Saccharofermentans sp.]
MKKIKVMACLVAVTMLSVLFAGCGKTTTITSEKFVKACEKLKLEEFELEDDGPEIDDLEDGIYAYADEDLIEDEPDEVEYFLRQLGLSEVIDADDVKSMALAAKCIGLEDFDDFEDPEELADLKVDGAFALQLSLDDNYAEDFMEFVEDMLDTAGIDEKDLTNKEFYASKNEGYFRFHIDVAKLAKILLNNDDVMDFVDSVYDEDDFEDLCKQLKGDVAISVEINGSNLFIIAGGSLNTKATVLNSFVSSFGAAANPVKVPMDEKLVDELIGDYVDDYGDVLKYYTRSFDF